VLICDDGQHAEPVDAFARERPDVTVIRRGNRLGFKAGNLNFAFDHAIDETVEWIVIADADQVLPPDYLSHMARAIEDVPSSVAFVQGAHDSTGETSGSTAPTIFQDALKYDIRLFYQRDLAWRESCGFLPFLGHGAAVSAAAWRSIGGFPELVSEDYAFALRISASGLKSHYADTVRSFEAFPKDFGAFVVRLKKFAGGSAQLIRREAWRFARSPASRVEKLDVAMLFLWYPLMPLVIANGLLSAFVCSRLWTLGIGALHPALPYVFLGMFILAAPVVRSVTDGYAAASRYWFWSTAVYTATLPMASWSFLRGLVIEPEFQPTPKGDAPTGRFRTAGVMTALLGLVCLNRAVAWWSPFSPLLVGYGVAYLSFPVLFHLHKPGTLGAIARASVFLPGAALIVALLTMWFWGRL
jgi:cellulose synthase/poly-beta-1,6-N-acetylglucosamine synthase-like glycosyltransferase